MSDEKKDEIYDKLLDGDFSEVVKVDDGYLVVKNYNSMRANAKLDKTGRIMSTGTDLTALSMILGLITLPIGTVILAVYILARKEERKTALKTKIMRCLR